MSAISTATSYASDISSLLLSNSSDASASSAAAAPAAPDPSSDSSDRGPATNVQLSDKVKSILAQANSDAVVAQRLQTFVQSRHTSSSSSDGSSDSSSSSQSTTIDVNESFAELSGNTQATSDPSGQTPVQVVKSFATGLKADGYTVSAMASDIDGSSRIIIFGTNGFNFLDEHFGSEDEASNGTAPTDGGSVSEYETGNVEYITINQASAAATSAQTSSAAGTASVSSTASQSSAVTIAVDFNTGQVSLTQASLTQAVATSAATTAQITQPSPSFSTFA
jgi:hypothetical protein